MQLMLTKWWRSSILAARKTLPVILGLCTMLSFVGPPAQADPVISWEDGASYVGRIVTVEGPVVCTGYSEGIGYINLGFCYPDPRRFTAAIPPAHRTAFASALGEDPLDAVAGQKVQVTGIVELYGVGEPIIWLRDPGQLFIPGGRFGSAEPRTPIIVDDDGSPDGVLALLYFLAHPDYEVVAATVSGGIARPADFAPNIARLLTYLDQTDVIVAAGREDPLSGANAFPDVWRDGATDFWGLYLPPATVSVDRRSAAEVIVDVVRESAERVVIFVSGSHTNLAEALRLDPTIASNIDHVSIMGGAIYVPGNIHHDWPEYLNEEAEWNIWVDPLAFEEVLASGMELRMAPLDATDLVPWREPHLTDLHNATSMLADMAYELFQLMLPLQYAWDLVAAATLEASGCCSLDSHCLRVELTGSLEEGKTTICHGPSNVFLCLDPDVASTRSEILDTLTGN